MAKDRFRLVDRRRHHTVTAAALDLERRPDLWGVARSKRCRLYGVRKIQVEMWTLAFPCLASHASVSSFYTVLYFEVDLEWMELSGKGQPIPRSGRRNPVGR